MVKLVLIDIKLYITTTANLLVIMCFITIICFSYARFVLYLCTNKVGNRGPKRVFLLLTCSQFNKNSYKFIINSNNSMSIANLTIKNLIKASENLKQNLVLESNVYYNVSKIKVTCT